MEKYNKRLGVFGEKAAAEYLAAQGYKMKEQNVYYRFGEIDLVAEKENELIFIEVKTRSSDVYGTPASAVGKTKQKRLWQSAEAYLSEHDWTGDVRFDIIEVYAKTERGEFLLDKLIHHKAVVMEV